MKIHTQLHWHKYRYFPYERDFARLELDGLFEVRRLREREGGLSASLVGDLDSLARLVYFQSFEQDGEQRETLQRQLESSGLNGRETRRQVTRYSLHGLHEYKGKFNPQVVRAIVNMLGLSEGSRVLDPFSGSGTTLLECAHAHIDATGFDVNPLAVAVANTKQRALRMRHTTLLNTFDDLHSTFSASRREFSKARKGLQWEYLSKWFDDEHLEIIGGLSRALEKKRGTSASLIRIIASDLLREYSLQEPADLRIRRRKTSMPDVALMKRLEERVLATADSIKHTRNVVGSGLPRNRAFVANSMSASAGSHLSEPVDAIITSPPYATALPYIDTQRLSLVWLGMLEPAQIKRLDAQLTGSREFSGSEHAMWRGRLVGNSDGLPRPVAGFCRRLAKALSDQDGFRRQAVPALLYRYFSQMKTVFEQALLTVRPDGFFALIVGHNHTTLGGERFDIDTPQLLVKVAETSGWSAERTVELQAYQRYGLHSSNSVRRETLLVLRRG